MASGSCAVSAAPAARWTVGRRQKKTPKNGGEPYDYFRYYCNGYLTKGRSVCQPVGIHREWLEGEVIKLLGREICSPERLAALKELVRKKIEARRNRYGTDPRELRRKLADVDRSIQNYYRAIGEGLDPTVCCEHIAKLEVEKEEIEQEAEILRKDDYYRRALETNIAELERFADAFETEFEKVPFKTQRQLILHFVEEIRVVDREVVRIKLKVPFDEGGVRHLTDELVRVQNGDSLPTTASEGMMSALEALRGRAGAVEGLGDERVAKHAAVLARERLGGHATWQRAHAADLDPVVEDRNGHVAARSRVVAVHHRVEQHLAQRLGRHGQAVLAEDLAGREVRGQRQGAVEPGHGLADHGEGVQVLLAVIEDVAGDLGPAKASQLEHALRVVG